MYNNYEIIALCISKIGSTRSFNFVHALNKVLVERGYRLFIYNTCSDLYWKTIQEKGERTVFDLIDYQKVDAILYFKEAFNDDTLISELHDKARASNVPFIPIGETLSDCTSILFDFETGFEKIVRHVVEDHNVRDVHFIAGRRNDEFSEQRINVFKKVIAENGIEYSPSMLSYGDFWSKPTRSAIERLINENRLPKAFICANDSMAIAAAEYLQERGYKVPEDIIVTGFDGIEEAENCLPPITTCECDYESIAKTITSILSGYILNTPVDRLYMLPYTPKIAVSCGCKKSMSMNDVSSMLKRVTDSFSWYQEDERHLYEVVAQALNCDSLLSLADVLSRIELADSSIALNLDCFDVKINPTQYTREASFDDEMYLLLQSDASSTDLIHMFSLSKILPNIDEILETENPVVFTSISYLGVPLGFVCFYFEAVRDYYIKIPQYVSTICDSVGGFRNMQHLKYMAKNIDYIYHHDSITNLLNRSGFFRELNSLIELGKTYMDPKIFVAGIEIKQLKLISDTYSRSEGDYIVNTVADALRNFALPHKLCARFDADEMVALALIDAAYEREYEHTGENFRNNVLDYLGKINAAAKKPYTISVDIGTCISDLRGFDLDTAISKTRKKAL